MTPRITIASTTTPPTTMAAGDFFCGTGGRMRGGLGGVTGFGGAGFTGDFATHSGQKFLDATAIARPD